MLKFVCQAYDGSSNPVEGGCGDVELAIIELKHSLGKDWENKEISISKEGKFMFTSSQLTKISKEKSPEKIIDIVSKWSSGGKFLYFAGCPNSSCKNSVKIYHLEAKDGV
jgi:hypothetical protein